MPITISLIGIYKFEYTKEMFLEQLQSSYRTEPYSPQAIEQITEQMDNTIIIELLVENNDGAFDYKQIYHGTNRDESPVPWNEQYLNREGTVNLKIDYPKTPKEKDFRMVFYLIPWNLARPLLKTQNGEIECPIPASFPERLRELIAWDALD